MNMNIFNNANNNIYVRKKNMLLLTIIKCAVNPPNNKNNELNKSASLPANQNKLYIIIKNTRRLREDVVVVWVVWCVRGGSGFSPLANLNTDIHYCVFR